MKQFWSGMLDLEAALATGYSVVVDAALSPVIFIPPKNEMKKGNIIP
jgi:hypothetical protein